MLTHCIAGPFRDFNQLTVYHPAEGHPFLSVAFTGFVGGLTGTCHLSFNTCDSKHSLITIIRSLHFHNDLYHRNVSHEAGYLGDRSSHARQHLWL